jgi:hypothetical protein
MLIKAIFPFGMESSGVDLATGDSCAEGGIVRIGSASTTNVFSTEVFVGVAIAISV